MLRSPAHNLSVVLAANVQVMLSFPIKSGSSLLLLSVNVFMFLAALSVCMLDQLSLAPSGIIPYSLQSGPLCTPELLRRDLAAARLVLKVDYGSGILTPELLQQHRLSVLLSEAQWLILVVWESPELFALPALQTGLVKLRAFKIFSCPCSESSYRLLSLT